MSEWDAAAEVIAAERENLKHWSGGNPQGYLSNAAPEITYFDDIGAIERMDGYEACLEYTGQLDGQIPPHTYEMDRVKVQVSGDTAVLTFLYRPSVGGQPGTPWKATCVYKRTPEGPRAIHSHWSMIKQA